MKSRIWKADQILNSLQSGFVGLLRLWSIPIVLMLSIASGYTTYYGMSRFITDWIALIITIAVQSIIIIATLEIATIRWKANRSRYLMIGLALIASLCVSISFSYFKFFEISQAQSIRIQNLFSLKQTVDDYLNRAYGTKTELLSKQRIKTQQSERDASLAYMGQHPDMAPKYKNLVGKGAFWKHFNAISQNEQQNLVKLENAFTTFDQKIAELRQQMRTFDLNSPESQQAYGSILSHFANVQTYFDELVTKQAQSTIKAPILPPYEEFVRAINPSFAMWQNFSLFAFICALMVDFFTILLSYRLESNAPGPLNQNERKLAFQCLQQFTQFNINPNDELELVIEKSEIEKARRYHDWTRLFGVSLLLNRGYLRKVTDKSVEFAPNLYPIIAEIMGEKASKPDLSADKKGKLTDEQSENLETIVKKISNG